jgi:hypothetical protein
MTLPRLMAMKKFWKENPPVRMMLQAKFGFVPKGTDNPDDPNRLVTDPEEAFSMLPSIAPEGLEHRG